MEAHDLLDAYGVIIQFPYLTVAVSNKPMIGASDHSDDVSRPVIRRVHDNLFFDRCDSDFKEIAGFSIIDILKLPPLDVAVTAGGDKELFFLIENNHLDEAFVERGLRLLV